MKPDYKRFSKNRELFPREQEKEFNANNLICGHLNRLKFPPNIDEYLHNREKGVAIKKSLAKAFRCFCRRDTAKKDINKEMINDIEAHFDQKRRIIDKLENTEIVLPRTKPRTLDFIS